VIRQETAADRAAVAALNDAAFGGSAESALVERLRDAGLATISLVAVEPEGLVGHLLLSPLEVEMDGRPVRSLALAPMAVALGRQRRGIGSALVREGLRLAREYGWEAVVVLGHPDYYPRFGFSAGLAARLQGPFAGPAFMALELVPAALAGERGRVAYPAAFGELG